MKEPVWILEDVVHAIHKRQLSEHGGEEGVRDEGLLLSALAKPLNNFSYEKEVDLFELAASYAFGIAKNHPFLDGNKRTAYVVCLTFLKLNGVGIGGSGEQKYRTMYELASGELSEKKFANWLRENSL